MGSIRQDIGTIYGNRTRLRVCGITIHQNQLLLVRHDGLGEKGQLWSFPGGGLEFGENLRETLHREYLEETGLEISSGRQLFIYEYLQPPLHAVEVYFQAEITGGKLQTGYDPEAPEQFQHLKEIRFVTFDELRVMEPEIKHEILTHVDSPESLLNLSGYFRF